MHACTVPCDRNQKILNPTIDEMPHCMIKSTVRFRPTINLRFDSQSIYSGFQIFLYVCFIFMDSLLHSPGMEISEF